MELAFGWSYFVLWFLVVAQGIVLLALLHELERLRKAEPEQPRLQTLIARRAPAFRFTEARTQSERGLDIFAARPGVLLFLTSTCGACRRLALGLASLPTSHPNLLVIWKNGAVDGLDPRVHYCTHEADEIAKTYGVDHYPTAVLLDGQQIVLGVTSPADVDHLYKLIDGGISALPVGPLSTAEPLPVG